MADITSIYNQTIPSYQKPEDVDFPVSKIRLLIDILWQAVTAKTLTDDQKTSLKQLIDLLNLLDEHKHESEKELIAAMLPSISPLLAKMPTLGLTGTHVFAHLVPVYQLYLPSIEQMVKEAHPFTMEETLLYYQLTIFDHLFLVHLFETEANLNLIEMLLTIKALILINALVYDYQQHVTGRAISFFTFLMRGGLTSDQLLPFLTDTVERIKEEVKVTVTNGACLETLDFLSAKLMDTTQQTQTPTTDETKALDTAMTSDQSAEEVIKEVTETPVEQPVPAATEPVAPIPTPEPVTEVPPTPVMTEPVTPSMPAPDAPTETTAPVPSMGLTGESVNASPEPPVSAPAPEPTVPVATEPVATMPEPVAPIETPVAPAPMEPAAPEAPAPEPASPVMPAPEATTEPAATVPYIGTPTVPESAPEPTAPAAPASPLAETPELQQTTPAGSSMMT